MTDILPILGGIHALMYIIDQIGTLMVNTGFSELWKVVFEGI